MTDLTPESLQRAAELRNGLVKMELDLSLAVQQKLLVYLSLLTKWNKVFNLTAVRDRSLMVTRQLLDSLSVLTFIKGERVLDVGTGGGLPGMPLAIADPDRHYYLLDSNGKKTRFLTQVKMEMRLDNVFVVQERIEQYVPAQPFDTIVSRAFASLDDMIEGSRAVLQPGRQWLAMKGKLPASEIAALAPGYSVDSQILHVPGEPADRRAVIITHN